jgi:hypothetical protein
MLDDASAQPVGRLRARQLGREVSGGKYFRAAWAGGRGRDATDNAAARQFSPSALAADIAAQDTARPGNLGLDVLEPLPKPRRTFAPSFSAVRPTTSGLNQGEFDGDSPLRSGR